MNIKTKYKVGQKVYVVFKEDNQFWANVFEDEIEQICITQNGIIYYVKKICEEFNEEDIIDYNDNDLLINKIKDLLSIEKVGNDK